MVRPTLPVRLHSLPTKTPYKQRLDLGKDDTTLNLFRTMRETTKSDYEVLPRNECKNAKGKSSDILKTLNSLKFWKPEKFKYNYVCLVSDVCKQGNKSDMEALEYLQKNRLILRLTNLEFLSIVPYPNRYASVVGKNQAKRGIIVSTQLWFDLQSIAAQTTKLDCIELVDERINVLVDEHTFIYQTDTNGITTRTKKFNPIFTNPIN